MGGQSNQTVRLPYDEFHDLDGDLFDEENLQQISNFPKEVKKNCK